MYDRMPDDVVIELAELAEQKWREIVQSKKQELDTVPIKLVLDSDWWIYLGQGKHPEILKAIISKINSGEFQLVTSEWVLKEWDRNLERTRMDARNLLLQESKSASKISHKLKGEEKKVFDKILNKYKTIEQEQLKLIDENIAVVDSIIKSKSIIVPLIDEVKGLVVEFGLTKKAPFGKKNSTGDAVIFLSAMNFLKNNMNSEVQNSIFISNNYKDFADSNSKIIKIHPDLKTHLIEANCIFERNLATAMKLSEEMQEKIDKYLESKAESILEDEYVQYEIDRYIAMDSERNRGK